MPDVITDNIDLWSSALLTRSTAGRGSNGKLEAYGIKKLRELILELSVRGKLVPQDPNDEPSIVLLDRLAKEKSRLIRNGKLRGKKSLSEITAEEKPFDIPVNWEWVRLGNIGEIFNGNSISESVKEAKYTDIVGGLPFIATKDIGYGWQPLDYNNGVSIPEEETSFKVAHKRSVLICAEGGSAGKKCGITVKDICFGNKLFAIEPYIEIEPSFLLANYLTPTFFAQFKEEMTGIIGGISLAGFNQLMVPLPSIKEQQRIVAKADELMAMCDQLEQQQTSNIEAHQTLVETLLGTLTNVESQEEFAEDWNRIADHFDTLFTTEQSIDKLKQTILQLAVMGKLVPQDSNDESARVLLEKIVEEKERLVKEGKMKKQSLLPKIGVDEAEYKIPKGWEWCRLQDVTRLITDGKHGDCNNLPDSGYFFLSAKDIQNGDLLYENARQIEPVEFAEVHQRTNLNPGDICMVNTGATVGKMAIATESELTYRTTFQKSVAVIKVATPLVDLRYIANYLLAETPKLLIKSGGSAINNLLLGDLKKRLVPLPPLSEQHRIVAKVNELMALCDSLKARLAAAKTTQVHLADTIVEQAVA